VKLARRIAAHEGHWFSIPANARRHEAFTRMLETLPPERILLETDCPYLGPVPGEPSEPAHVRGTADYAADRWQVGVDEAWERLARNFEALFGEPP
jgi:TatD DNase family protein